MPYRRARRQAAMKAVSAACRNQPSQTLSPRPSSPTRFMPSFQSPVPISGRPWLPTARLWSSARAQCSNSVPALVGRRRAGRTRRARPRCSAGPVRKATVSSSTAASPVAVDIVRDDIGEPDAVVGDARAHAAAGFRQPPMLHVALDELPPGRAQQVFARQIRPGRRTAPCRPAAGRGSHRRRSPDRSRRAPRRGTRASDRAANR